jgi:3-hydroxyethyl bacteriochlorophyllide a dehydrogenase
LMKSLAVVIEEPRRLALASLPIDEPRPIDVIVESRWSGVSAGTEKRLYYGDMPNFPGMGYPLVPGYETVGSVVSAGPRAGVEVGATVFVPGARCFGAVRGMHGGSASRLVAEGARVLPIDSALGERGVLLALAATALHALKIAQPQAKTLIVGHGALGRLIARLAVARGVETMVWESDPARRDGALGYRTVAAADDPYPSYDSIIDVSGDARALDTLIQRLAPGGQITLAGFYDVVSFAFPPAFMREARFRIAAQWGAGDLAEARDLAQSGALSLDGLITHRLAAREAETAYPLAFNDPACVKMVLDWSAT